MTVNKVVMTGVLVVNGPVILFFLLGLFFSGLLKNNDIGVYHLIGTFIFSWLWWSFAIVKWRLWAYKQVKTEHIGDLKRAAVNAFLTWPDDNIFAKTEIKTPEEERIEKEMENEAGERAVVKSTFMRPYLYYIFLFIAIFFIIFLSNFLRH